jgi:hypothetical protein
MIVMHLFLAVAGAVAFGLLGVSGIASIARGWVAPWGRARVLRPKLWGYGSLLGAVGGAVYFYLGPLAQEYGLLPWLGWFAFMAGLGLQVLAQRPGHAATKTAS